MNIKVSLKGCTWVDCMHLYLFGGGSKTWCMNFIMKHGEWWMKCIHYGWKVDGGWNWWLEEGWFTVDKIWMSMEKNCDIPHECPRKNSSMNDKICYIIYM